MKFPSLFTKTPAYHRFEYKPRYYDPQKEEMQEREARIRQELELERGKQSTQQAGETREDYRTRIKGSFQRARKRSKTSEEANAVMIRLAVLLFITLFLIAFLTWGGVAMYGLFLFLPVYVYFKFFRK